MKNIVLASTSTLYQQTYLNYLLPSIQKLFSNVTEVLFIPFAQPSGISYNNYTQMVQETFSSIKINIVGIHEFENYEEAIQQAKGIFTGGGNTFLLLDQLQKHHLLSSLQKVINNGTPYLGTSAGSNIAGISIHTSNDMPIVLPKNLNALQLIPFNLNVHYIEKSNLETHMGESRATRIKEFLTIHDTPVLGLPEGTWLEISDNNIFLRGNHDAVLFTKTQTIRISTNTTITI